MAKSKSPLGDTRLIRPFTELVDAMTEKLTVVIRQLGSERKEEISFGRLVNNSKVTPTNLVKQYWQNNPIDWRVKHVLVIEDGSKMSFVLYKDRKGLGYVGASKKIGGFEVHNALLLDAQDYSCYGLGSAQVYNNDKETGTDKATEEEKKAKKKANRERPFNEKESYKWYSTALEATKNAAGASQYTIIGDREADIYDALERFEAHSWDYNIRSSSNRRVMYQDTLYTLYQVIDSWTVSHTYPLSLASTKKRTKHEAKLHLKFGQLQLLRPTTHPDKTLAAQIPVYVVEVKEDPLTVVLGEKPVHWILITSHKVTDIQQALQIVQWYCERWNIEQTYRTLKTDGLNVEQSDVETFQALANLTVLALIAATQVMQLVRARTGNTQQNMDCVFSPQEIKCIEALNPTLEGNTEKLKNPHPPKSLAFAAWVMARLAGWSGYAKQPPPGPITFVNGLVQFYAISKGFNLRL
jgi:Transposase DDE domain